MKIINNNFNNQNFYGYKNIIVNSIEDEIGYTYSLSAQLNNIGERDLDKFLALKKNLDINDNIKNCDVINLTLVNTFKGAKEILIENIPWLSGNELNTLVGEIPNDIYQKIETNMLKGYDFIASILKRISHDKNIEEDNDFYKTINSYKNNVQSLSDSKEIADEVVYLALYDREEPQPIAEKMQSYIKSTMDDFFD